MLYINFSAEINIHTSEGLMNLLSKWINEGEEEFYFLFSSSGGVVRDGITLYNYMESLPAKIIMHNIGMVDSIANVVFMAGDERFAVPNSSFLFHGVGFSITQPTRLEMKELKERIKSIDRDQTLISQIIANKSNLSVDEIKNFFMELQTKTPEEAKKIDLIQDIKEVKIPKGANIISTEFQRRPWR